MTTYVLRSGSDVVLDAGPLVAGVRSEVADVGHRWSARGATVEPPTIVRPDRIVLPAITEPTVLRILPDGEDRFGPQTIVSLSLGHDRGGEDADRVLMDDLDLSGLTHRDLVELVPDGQRIKIIGLRTVADTRLSPVAEAARDAAREILGVPQVAPEHATDVEMVIDTSASMRPAFGDGSVVATCEVLAGVGVVVAPDRRITATAGSLGRTTVARTTPDRLAADVAAALADPSLSTGFRSAPATESGPDSGWTVIISSGVPADWQPAPRCSVVILTAATDAEAADPDAGLCRVARPGLIADPPDRGTITAAVAGLLASLRAPEQQPIGAERSGGTP